MAACAIGVEIWFAAMTQNRFRHDGARRIAGAQEQNVERLVHEPTSVAAGKIHTARWAFARRGCWFAGAQERAHELVFYERSDFVCVKASRAQKLTRLFDLINPRRFHFNRHEPCSSKLFDVLALLQRARDATDPQFHALADV